MREVLLDTDTISFFFRGNKNIHTKVNEYLSERESLNISVITYYEILNGLYYKDAKAQLQRFLDFVEVNKIIPLTEKSSKISAGIMADLRKSGQVIGHNDVLIAGIALESEFIMVTNNVSHFSRIKGLKVENWVA